MSESELRIGIDEYEAWMRRHREEIQPFVDLGIPMMTINALFQGGYRSLESVSNATDDELLGLRQLGKRGLRYIRDAIPPEQSPPLVQWDQALQRYVFDDGKEFFVMTRPLMPSEAEAAYVYWLVHRDGEEP